MNKKKRISLRR